MSVQASDLKFFKSATVSDAANNGGRVSTNQVVSGVKNNLFPNVTHTERTSGLTRRRKQFLKNEESTGLALNYTRVWIGRITPAQDYLRIKEGTNTDIQSDTTAYTLWSGAGILNESITAGVTNSFDVVFDTTDGVYDGGYVHLDDGSNEEFITLASSGGVTWAGNIATLTIAASGTVVKSYPITTTTVASTLDLAVLNATSDNWIETGSGTYNEVTYPLTVYNQGTVEDSWTLTFTSSTAFSVSGTVTGSVGTGTTSGDFKPANGSSYYFKIDAAGWGGGWATSDTITFDTHHSAKSIWAKEVVPAASASYTNNNPRLDIYGESGDSISSSSSSSSSLSSSSLSSSSLSSSSSSSSSLSSSSSSLSSSSSSSSSST